MSNQKKLYRVMALTGFVLWLSETAYFGWNMKPESGIEFMLDQVAVILIMWGIIGDLTHNLVINRYTTKNYDIKTEKMIFENGKEILTDAVKQHAEDERQGLIRRLTGQDSKRDEGDKQ